MTLGFAHGAVQWLAADGVGVTYTVSGLTFQPKALRFYWNGIQSATNATSQVVHSRRGVGFAVSATSRRSVATFSADVSAAADCASAVSDDCVVSTLTGAAARDGLLDLDAILADGFRLIVDDIAPANITVFWEAWGGSDITVAAIGDILELGAAGNADYTVTGFTADGTDQVVLFAGVESAQNLNTGFAEASALAIGFASSGAAADNVVVLGSSDDGSATMDTDGYGLGGECLAMMVLAGGNPNARATLTQFGANNFRLNWIAVTTLNRRSAFLAIKGGRWDVGKLAIDATTLNATSTVSGLTFQPKGISFIGRGTAEQAAGISSVQDRISMGTASSTTSRQAMGVLDLDGAADSAISTIVNYAAVIAHQNATDTVLIDLDVLNVDGFRLIVDDVWAAGGSTTEWIGFLAFADAPTIGSASGIGAATGNVASIGTASGIGNAIGQVASIGESIGIGAAIGQIASIGAAAGIGNATGQVASTGNAAGTGIATGIVASIGAASGVGAANGIYIESSAIGSASGIGTATGIVASIGVAAAVGAATGNVASIGSSIGTGAATGIIASIGSAAGIGAAIGLVASIGAALGTGVATGLVASISNASGIGVASGISDASSVGSASGTGNATGRVASHGSASGIGNAVGTTSSTGAAVGSGIAVGYVASSGAAAGIGLAIGMPASVVSAAGIGTAIGLVASLGAAIAVGTAIGHSSTFAIKPFIVVEDEAVLVGTIGFKRVAAGAETQTVTVPRTDDVSTIALTKSRFSHCQIDVELLVAGVVDVFWDTRVASELVPIISGRRQVLTVPSGAKTLSIVFPLGGTVTVVFGRMEI